MAHVISHDSMDFAEYERNTEAASKVRHAADFIEDVAREFQERERGKRYASMISTKARNLIEFRPGEVTCWTGFNGHRKSLFVGQVALDMCVQRERVLEASFEMQPAKTLARISRQAAALARPDARWLEMFGHWTNGRLWLFDHMGRVTPELCLGVCRFFANELSGTQVFIDSMMMVCGSEEHIDEQKQFVTDICRVAHDTGLHVHLVAHARKPQTGEERPMSKYDIRGAAAISDQVDNVVSVWMDKTKRSKLEANPHDEEWLAKPDMLVDVLKQRNDSWEGRMKLWFDSSSLRFVDDRTSLVEPYELTRAQAHLGV